MIMFMSLSLFILLNIYCNIFLFVARWWCLSKLRTIFWSLPSVCISVCLFLFLSLSLSVCLSVRLCLFLSLYLSVIRSFLSVSLAICLSIFLYLYFLEHRAKIIYTFRVPSFFPSLFTLSQPAWLWRRSVFVCLSFYLFLYSLHWLSQDDRVIIQIQSNPLQNNCIPKRSRYNRGEFKSS